MKDAATWVPLRYYLRVQHRRAATLTLSFRQIEAILGDGLPKAARKYPDWWENDAAHAQASAWLNEGWRVAEANLTEEVVHFRHGAAQT
jgi:hypothetical protein